MTQKSEIQALISLLDDSDEEVVKHVTEKLLSLGDNIIPLLEAEFNQLQNNSLRDRLSSVINQMQTKNMSYDLVNWAKSGGDDLFEGAWLIARFRYKQLDRLYLNNLIDKIKLDCWLEMSNHQTPVEKVRVINHVLFGKYKISGNQENYHHPDNSHINRVLETGKGNPISLSIIYSIVCQRLNMPVFGVNLPQHFVLAYKDDKYFQKQPYNTLKYIRPDLPAEVLFYINPFNKGIIFSRWNIDKFLSQLNIQPIEMYYEPCSNVDTIMRVIRNLIFSYEKRGDKERMEKLQSLHEELIPYGSETT